MTVTVLLFARVADLLGAASVTLTLPDPARAGDVLPALRALPGGDGIPPSTRIAINHAFAADDAPVAPGDEVAVIPPVAGG